VKKEKTEKMGYLNYLDSFDNHFLAAENPENFEGANLQPTLSEIVHSGRP